MKKALVGCTRHVLAAGAALFLAGLVLADATAETRTWTSRFGARSIEGEFSELRDGKVMLKKADGATLSIPLASLSAGDQEFANAEQAKLDAANQVDVIASMKNRMVRFVGGKMEPFSFAEGKEPRHILFYVISSACPSCRDYAPLTKEYSKETLTEDSGIAVVIVSIDEEADDQEEFIAGQNLPFPAIAHASMAEFETAITPRIFSKGFDGCQTYILTTSEGKLISKTALVPKREIAKILEKRSQNEVQPAENQ